MLKQATKTKAWQPFLFPASPPPGLVVSPSVKERGAVFTRSETVEFILDLAGYTPDKPLHLSRLLEPSFGNGDFLLVAVERLLTAYGKHHLEGSSIFDDLADAIRAVEVDHATCKKTSEKLKQLLTKSGVSPIDAERLIAAWIMEGDFLLMEMPHRFTFAVGNPPYVRQELIPDELMAVYRERFETIYDRADLYVPFIERSLNLLEPGGTLGFICADRWMKNRYGGPLRALVAEGFHLKCYVDMVDTAAFHSEVSAYPAITIITREKPGPTRLAHRPAIDRATLRKLAASLASKTVTVASGVTEVAKVVNGPEPWILHSFDQLAIVRRLEERFPTLEEAGCKVSIGVATGADKAFIGLYNALDVEPACKLPLVTTKDIRSGKVKWQGLGVINPFREDGSLVNLTDYPRLARYIEERREVISKRNCARKNPKNWFRTIDRIYPEIAERPKLLIPDIKGEANIVYEEGRLYPHHNLYYITSNEWDLHALQAVLKSGIAKLFVSIYSTQMRGGYLRYQAQYLRRIRVPRWSDVPEGMRKTLIEAARAGDVEACNHATFELFELSKEERSAIGGNGK
ncbi:MAG: Eco57I restriction-modification methylase domain-containing protein [Oryzomonas sp.]|jgi:hypothetical protein